MKRIITVLALVVFGVAGLFGQVSNPTIEIEQPIWEKIITPAKGLNLSSFSEANGRMWIVDNGLFFSDDSGQSWERHPDSGLPNIEQVFATDFGVMYTRLNRIYPWFNANIYYDIYFSNNNGSSFSQIDASLNLISTSTHGSGSSKGIFKKSSSELIQIYYSDGLGGPGILLLNSEDGGNTWNSNPIFHPNSVYPLSELKYALQRDTLSILSTTLDSTWILQTFTEDYNNPSVDSFTLTLSGSTLIDDFHFQDRKITMITDDGRILASNDLGQNWTIYNNDISELIVDAEVIYGIEEILIKVDSLLYTIDYNNLEIAELIFTAPTTTEFTIKQSEAGLLLSTSSGIFIKPINTEELSFLGDGAPGTASDFKIASNVIWTKTGIWYRSDDEGISWTPAPLSILDNARILTDYNNVFFLEKNNEVFRSTDNGFTWDQQITFQDHVQFVKHENKIFLYDKNQIYFSEDGINFIETTHPTGDGNFVWHQNQLLYFSDGQRYISVNNGIDWDVPESTNGENQGIILSNIGQLINIEQDGTLPTIRQSNDSGSSWIYNDNIYPLFFNYATLSPPYLGIHQDVLFFSLIDRTYLSTNNGDHWGYFSTPFISRVPYFLNPDNFIFGPKKIRATEEYLYGIGDNHEIYRTSLSFLKNQLPDSIIIKNQITGHLYKDRNDNCLLDSMDSPIPYKVINVGDQYLRTDDQGWYGLFYDFTNEEVPYQTDSIRHTEYHCENDYEGIFQLNQNQNVDTLDIAFYPTPDIIDGGITAWTLGVFRPGGTPQIRIKITNHGSVSLVDEQIILTYDPSKQSINTNSIGTILGNNQWQIPVSLAPEESDIFVIRLNINTTVSINDPLTYSINLPITNDAYLADNQTSFSENIVTSIDPNDKTAYENTTLPYTQNEFIYRIRFQNTGNDTAFKVVVLDTLPPELDVFTLEMLGSSHPYELKIHNPVLRWTFRDILLPDSTTNEAESHGYLFFKIKTKDDLVITDTIKNSAAIYFDYNDPVITEDAVTAIEKGYREIDHLVSFCPGAIIDGTTIFSDTTILVIDSTSDSINDIGINLTIELFPEYHIDSLLTLHPGDTILGIAVYSDTTIVYQGLTEMYGCDSIINYQIALLTNTADLEKISFTAQVQPNPTLESTVLVLNTTENIKVNISLYHLTGPSVKTILPNRMLSAGRHELPINLEEVPPGVYFLKIETTQGKEVLRILKIE